MTLIKNETVMVLIYVLIWLTGTHNLQSKNFKCFCRISTTGSTQITEASKDTGSVNPNLLFTKADADQIIGEPTYLATSSLKKEPNVVSYLYGYKADLKDHRTGKTGAIYFLFEQYRDISSAKVKYKSIYRANKPHGVEEVDNLGDEAYYHTDGENFDFIMVRKGKCVFNMKVNKRTSTWRIRSH